jgi:hypothetical protein
VSRRGGTPSIPAPKPQSELTHDIYKKAAIVETVKRDVIAVTNCERPSLNGVYQRVSAGDAASEPIPEAEYIEGLKTVLPQVEEHVPEQRFPDARLGEATFVCRHCDGAFATGGTG